VAAPRRRRRRGARPAPTVRYTIDASVFVNAFNLHESGHAASRQLLEAIQERADPVLVPALLIPEVASAVARATGDTAGAVEYATAMADLPSLTVIPLTMPTARHAASLAATHRLRGADAIYLAVAQRYGTTLVSRDAEQRSRGAAMAPCQTPEEALAERARR
jgi:predicted nucleic acid-binding protein